LTVPGYGTAKKCLRDHRTEIQSYRLSREEWILRRIDRYELIGIQLGREMRSLAANVGDRPQQLSRKFLLNAEAPLLRVRPCRSGWNRCDADRESFATGRGCAATFPNISDTSPGRHTVLRHTKNAAGVRISRAAF